MICKKRPCNFLGAYKTKVILDIATLWPNINLPADVAVSFSDTMSRRGVWAGEARTCVVKKTTRAQSGTLIIAVEEEFSWLWPTCNPPTMISMKAKDKQERMPKEEETSRTFESRSVGRRECAVYYPCPVDQASQRFPEGHFVYVVKSYKYGLYSYKCILVQWSTGWCERDEKGYSWYDVGDFFLFVFE